MNKLQATLAALLLSAGALWAAPLPVQPLSQPSARLQHLVGELPPVGMSADFKKLGVQLSAVRTAPPLELQAQSADYTLYYPSDLDRRSTEEAPFAGRWPGVHLNLPLKVQPSYINYLFISDQPERVQDNRLREPAAAPGSPQPEPGATGIYARSPIPKGSTTRVLVDHTNGTKRPLRFDLVWIPDAPGFLSVKKRSLSVHQDSVAAGSRAFSDQAEIVVEPRRELIPDQATVLVSQLLKPEDTVVLHEEFYSSSAGQLAAMISEPAAEAAGNVAALDATPVLHSIMWKEEEDRLGKFIDKNQDPTRWNRIKESYQHARGHFASPDRNAEIDYAVTSWDEAAYPLRAYSKFESIPGVDSTVKTGLTGATAVTDNRGKYGARVGLRWNLKALPPGCKEMAVVCLNRGATFGGRHWVSDGRRTVSEIYHQSGRSPGLLTKNQACTLWRGPVSAGDQLQMWTEPMANTSVQLWYLLVPIPPAPAPVAPPT